MEFSINDRTTEIFPYAPWKLRRVRPFGENKWELQCEGFTLRNSFPDNVVRLADGAFFVIDQFDKLLEFRFLMTGYRFMSCTKINNRSEDYYSVQNLNIRREQVSTSALRAKCYIFPFEEKPELYCLSGSELDPRKNVDLKYAVSVLM